MLEDRILTKLGLDANKVKLHMRYNPRLFGVEEEMNVCDDEDVFAYVTSAKNNRRSVLVVEEISKPPEQLSRVGKSTVVKNYIELNSEEDEMRVDDGALIVLLEEEQGNQQQLETIVEEDHGTQEDETRYDESMDNFDKGNSMAALHEVVDRAAFANSFGYVIKKSDKERYVLKYNKMHSCTRLSKGGTRLRKWKGNPQLVAALLHDHFPGQLETPVPRIIMELVQTKLGEKITLSMLEDRIMTKLGLDANKVKLHMRYNPRLFGVEEEMNVCDDEDVFIYATSAKNNRRSVLVVEEISKPPEQEQLPEQLSRVGKSSVGKNYTELNSEEDEMRVDDGALIVLLEEEQGTQHQLEAIVEDHGTQEDETRYDESMDNSDRGEQYVESPPAIEPGLVWVVQTGDSEYVAVEAEEAAVVMVAETEKEETFSPTDTVKDDYVVNRSRTVSRKGSMSVKILVVYDNEGSDSGSQFASTTSRSFTVTRKH
ncbi:hypothetical protein AXX17_AT4G08570 [Arabidopsis thaliana]|uniref:MULE transposase N-terminal all-beta domain-containing protein n=1 Tax=Arabidopsis thaliana TaxID=3702 RepID=A0A178V6P6_ARATH|nr:hypothetical protein AXX17_AT4G08570 [Arabidopsis thaliana]